jgi:hypothetical protein
MTVPSSSCCWLIAMPWRAVVCEGIVGCASVARSHLAVPITAAGDGMRPFDWGRIGQVSD